MTLAKKTIIFWGMSAFVSAANQTLIDIGAESHGSLAMWGLTVTTAGLLLYPMACWATGDHD